MNQRSETTQPIRRLYDGLSRLASPERYLFTPSDMRALVPDISAEAYRALLRPRSPGRQVGGVSAVDSISIGQPSRQPACCCFMPQRACAHMNSTT
jgi:hypothetical protein